jgi:hypothetical protein
LVRMMRTSEGCSVVESILVTIVMSKLARRNAVVIGLPKLPEACWSLRISYMC